MYIAEEIHKINKNIQLVWLVDNIESFEFPDYIKVVKVDSILGLYMRATARVWVDNIRHRHPVKKKESQLYLQTWHGSMGVKKIEKDAESKLPKEYIKQAKYDGQIIDAIIADN
ncbi:CDP-glycerol glycerophosphotransferase family protein, partial [Enterococcus cecorum]|nr:CDP-glycerol glycerophosphotransferase family protein [Enterococcus cecorum]